MRAACWRVPPRTMPMDCRGEVFQFVFLASLGQAGCGPFIVYPEGKTSEARLYHRLLM